MKNFCVALVFVGLMGTGFSVSAAEDIGDIDERSKTLVEAVTPNYYVPIEPPDLAPQIVTSCTMTNGCFVCIKRDWWLFITCRPTLVSMNAGCECALTSSSQDCFEVGTCTYTNEAPKI